MATEYKIENRNLYIYLDGELDHHLAKKIKYQCDIILKSYPIKDIEFDFTNSPFIDSSGIGAVSYTHLDVYKRQFWGNIAEDDRCWTIKWNLWSLYIKRT